MMMQLKQTAAAIVLGLSFAGFAQADGFVKDLGTLTAGGELIAVGNYNNLSASGDFAYWYTFTIDTNVLSADGTASITFQNTSHTLDFVTISVYEGSFTGNNKNRLNSLVKVDSFTSLPGVDSVTGTFTFDQSLTNYTFAITGKAYGNGAFNFALAAPAVPEPAEYAMLLAGLGLVGMVARRRKINVN
ncbi:MAG: FxDxF family PEP-CTERM protein [Proteobacteria bacterium]|nr:FxDxF family PEP-CTERM protein [Pseudomonadota bacterium]